MSTTRREPITSASRYYCPPAPHPPASSGADSPPRCPERRCSRAVTDPRLVCGGVRELVSLRSGGEGDRQPAQPRHAGVAHVLIDTTEVDLVVGDAVENRLDHYLGHQARQVRSDAAMWSEPEGDVAVGCPIENDFVGLLEFLLVVVGGQPADDDAVVALQVLAADGDVARHRAAQ